MEKIESWVSHLDRRHATWLLRWLIKERQPARISEKLPADYK
jgi:hypothetical protein